MGRPLAAALLTLLAAFFAQAQDKPKEEEKPAVAKDETATEIELVRKEVDTALEALDKDTTTDENVKANRRKAYEEARQQLSDAVKFSESAAKYQDALTTAPDETKNYKTELEQLKPADLGPRPGKSLSDLKTLRDTAQGTLSGLEQKQFQDDDATDERAGKLGEETTSAKMKLSEVDEKLAAPDIKTDNRSADKEAEYYQLKAEQLKLNRQLKSLELENESFRVRKQRFQAEKELNDAKIERAKGLVAHLEKLVAKSSADRGKAIENVVDWLQRLLPADDVEAQALAAEVKDLALDLQATSSLPPLVTTASDKLKRDQTQLSTRYNGIRDQLAAGGAQIEMARVLVDLRDLLENRATAARVNATTYDRGKTQLSSLKVDFKLSLHSEVVDRFADRQSVTVDELLDNRKEVLTHLQSAYEDLAPKMRSFDTETRGYLTLIETVREYIDGQLFWLRIIPPANIENSGKIWQGLVWTFRSEHFAEFGEAVAHGYGTSPTTATACIVLFIVLMVFRRRILRGLAATAQPVRRISTDSYRYTGYAMVWTVLLAAPVPLLFGLIVWLASSPETQSTWMHGVLIGWTHALGVVTTAALIDALCRRDGICLVHFRWRADTTERFRITVICFAFIMAPLVILTWSTVFDSNPDYLAGAGRFCFVLEQFGGFVVLSQILFRRDGVLQLVGDFSSRLIGGLRYLWALALLAFPVSVTVLASLGYMVTAVKISTGFANSLNAICLGVFLYALTLRWFMIRHRKLALAEAIDRRQAAAEARQSDEEEGGDDEITVDEEEEALDLDAIGSQTRKMLGVLFSLIVAIAVSMIWSSMLPLMKALEGVTVPLSGGLSLIAAGQAVAVIIITWVAMKNLPGVLELAILRTTTIDPGTRTAITTICQYTVVGVGTFVLFNVLQLDWSKYGWIAGGLSVGIGFGLQEVVANFVCGLILLFERPVRVGDVVTIDGDLGTVTRIHLRSTTITNFDRGEVILPNKTLITTKLINWTLTAPLNRVVLRVSVAYGTDTEAARQILLSIAADNPNCLEDPAPMALIDKMSDSAIELLLRAFLPDRSNRESTITDLFAEIQRRFNDANIEIPYPHHVVHVSNDDQLVEDVRRQWVEE